MIYEIFYLPYISYYLLHPSISLIFKRKKLAYMYIWLVQENTNHLLVGRMMTKNHLYHHPCITKIVIFINILNCFFFHHQYLIFSTIMNKKLNNHDTNLRATCSYTCYLFSNMRLTVGFFLIQGHK
ncbi:hypothetical protein ACJX0J_013371, partial [Zea mays]